MLSANDCYSDPIDEGVNATLCLKFVLGMLSLRVKELRNYHAVRKFSIRHTRC